MNWVTEFLVPVVAVIGSLVGILVALDQITAGSRLRRQAIFWREMSQNVEVSHDAAVFQSLEREASAKLIALQALPARKLLLPAFMVTSAIAFAFSIGMALGHIPAADWNWTRAIEKTSEQGADMIFWPLIPFLIGKGILDFLNLLLERSQIATAYLDGRTVDVKRFRIDDRSPMDAFGWAGLFQLLAVSLGLASTATAIGASTGGMSPNSWTSWLLLGGAALLFWPALMLFANVQHVTTREWRHPRPLPRQHRRVPSTFGGTRKAHRLGRPRR
ncbi:hypothetical protein [Arthrobacter sp. OV608]|uniref:hypothetical protein n=1 Tax=Arthrobacter sp. OV608 TaxID=1882768 RepID=UPI0008BC2D7A|nr:hypothetical protein [Arthrobacter sp. OV608]SEQ03851.1 hypothetical protein SAMN05444745_103252 [Arthrobacter sp. OV608]